MKKYIFVIIFTLAVVLWVGFIFSNSAQTGEESGATSSDVQEAINGILHSLGIDLSLSEHFIRKAAHFTEYMILGFIVCFDVSAILKLFDAKKLKSRALALSLAVPFSAAVALIDEFVVQRATEGRGPSFVDVRIDTCGAALGVIIVLIAVFFSAYLKNVKINKGAE